VKARAVRGLDPANSEEEGEKNEKKKDKDGRAIGKCINSQVTAPAQLGSVLQLLLFFVLCRMNGNPRLAP
jgi:hypothetical protein